MTSYFAKNLKYIRELKNLDQQKMANDLNIPQSTLSCWENNLRTPKIETIIDIAEYLNVDIDIISRDYSIKINDKELIKQYKILLKKDYYLNDKQKDYILNIIKNEHKNR